MPSRGYRLVLDNRREDQRVEVHCVLTKDNIPYAEDWWDFFGVNYPDAVRILSPLVASYDNKPSQDSMGHYSLDDMERLVIQASRALRVGCGPAHSSPMRSLASFGTILVLMLRVICLNVVIGSPPDEVNFGNVFEMEEEGYTLKDAWRSAY